jgi:hypothetical protein
MPPFAVPASIKSLARSAANGVVQLLSGTTSDAGTGQELSYGFLLRGRSLSVDAGVGNGRTAQLGANVNGQLWAAVQDRLSFDAGGNEPLIASSSPSWRMSNGSDWWLNRFFAGAPEYLDKFKTNFGRLFPGDDSLLADVFGRNALRFLGLTRDGGSRAANGDRLVRLYQVAGQALPPWLAG